LPGHCSAKQEGCAARKRVPLVHGVPALSSTTCFTNLSVVLMVFVGACLMLFVIRVPIVAREVLIIIAVVAFLGLVAAALATRRRRHAADKHHRSFGAPGFRPNSCASRRRHIYRVELTVYGSTAPASSFLLR